MGLSTISLGMSVSKEKGKKREEKLCGQEKVVLDSQVFA
jgi:hypothetical protein